MRIDINQTRFVSGIVQEASAESTDRKLQFIFSDTSEDSHNSVILDWDLSAYQKNPVVLTNHDPTMDPVGSAWVNWDGKTLDGYVDFYTDSRSNEQYEKYKRKDKRAVSVGFTIVDYEFKENGLLVIKKAKLREISLVSVGSNENALSRGLKTKMEHLQEIGSALGVAPEIGSVLGAVRGLMDSRSALQSELNALKEAEKQRQAVALEAERVASITSLESAGVVRAESIEWLKKQTIDVVRTYVKAHEGCAHKTQPTRTPSEASSVVAFDGRSIDEISKLPDSEYYNALAQIDSTGNKALFASVTALRGKK